MKVNELFDVRGMLELEHEMILSQGGRVGEMNEFKSGDDAKIIGAVIAGVYFYEYFCSIFARF